MEDSDMQTMVRLLKELKEENKEIKMDISNILVTLTNMEYPNYKIMTGLERLFGKPLKDIKDCPITDGIRIVPYAKFDMRCYYDKNDVLYKIGTYDNKNKGKLISIEDEACITEYDIKGNITKEQYIDDDSIYCFEYYDNGNKSTERWYNKKLREHRNTFAPAYVEYFRDGSIKEKYYYVDGIPVFKDGTMFNCFIYRNDNGYYLYEEKNRIGPTSNNIGELSGKIRSRKYNSKGSIIREERYPILENEESPDDDRKATIIEYDDNCNIKKLEWLVYMPKTLLIQYHRTNAPAIIEYFPGTSMKPKMEYYVLGHRINIE